MNMETYNELEQDVRVDELMLKLSTMKEPKFFNPKSLMSLEEERKIIANAPVGRKHLSIRKSKGAMCRCNHGRVAHNESCDYKNCDCTYFSIRPSTWG